MIINKYAKTVLFFFFFVCVICVRKFLMIINKYAMGCPK